MDAGNARGNMWLKTIHILLSNPLTFVHMSKQAMPIIFKVVNGQMNDAKAINYFIAILRCSNTISMPVFWMGGRSGLQVNLNNLGNATKKLEEISPSSKLSLQKSLTHIAKFTILPFYGMWTFTSNMSYL